MYLGANAKYNPEATHKRQLLATDTNWSLRPKTKNFETETTERKHEPTYTRTASLGDASKLLPAAKHDTEAQTKLAATSSEVCLKDNRYKTFSNAVHFNDDCQPYTKQTDSIKI